MFWTQSSVTALPYWISLAEVSEKKFLLLFYKQGNDVTFLYSGCSIRFLTDPNQTLQTYCENSDAFHVCMIPKNWFTSVNHFFELIYNPTWISTVEMRPLSSIQIGILGHFPPCICLGWEVLGYFEVKNKTKKVVKTHKDFEL